jgi:hypothetical protein
MESVPSKELARQGSSWPNKPDCDVTQVLRLVRICTRNAQRHERVSYPLRSTDQSRMCVWSNRHRGHGNQRYGRSVDPRGVQEACISKLDRDAGLDCPAILENDRVVTDDRVPGDNTDPNALKYKCDYPGGCSHTEWSLIVPTCPTHLRQMIVVNEDEQSSTSQT